MKNRDKLILDEEDFWKIKKLTNRQLASLVQSKVRYSNYILAKIDTEIDRRNLEKRELLEVILLEKNNKSVGEKFILFYKKNKTATTFLSVFSILSLFKSPFVSLIIIFSIYFSLKK